MPSPNYLLLLPSSFLLKCIRTRTRLTTSRMDFSDFDLFNTNGLDKPNTNIITTNTTTYSDETSTFTYDLHSDTTSTSTNTEPNELDRVLDVLYESIFNNPNPAFSEKSSDDESFRLLSTTGSTYDSDATVDPNATPISPHKQFSTDNRDPQCVTTNGNIGEREYEMSRNTLNKSQVPIHNEINITIGIEQNKKTITMDTMEKITNCCLPYHVMNTLKTVLFKNFLEYRTKYISLFKTYSIYEKSISYKQINFYTLKTGIVPTKELIDETIIM